MDDNFLRDPLGQGGRSPTRADDGLGIPKKVGLDARLLPAAPLPPLPSPATIPKPSQPAAAASPVQEAITGGGGASSHDKPAVDAPMKRPGWGLAAAAMVFALAVGSGLVLHAFHVPPAVAVDTLTVADAQHRVAEWSHASLEVKATDADSIQITAWDDCAQDGDVVTITSGAVSKTVYLKNAGEVLILPRSPSGAITITGVHDGGGGITLGIVGSGAEVHTPVMQPGEVLTLPVR